MMKKFLIYALCAMVLCAFTPLVSFAADADGGGSAAVKEQAEADANAAEADQDASVEKKGKNPDKDVTQAKELHAVEGQVLPKKEPVDPEAIDTEAEDDGLSDAEGMKPLSTAGYYGTFYEYYNAEESMAVLDAINAARADHGLGALVYDDVEEDFAMCRALECAIYNSYTRPDGSAGDEYWSDGTYEYASDFVADDYYYNYDPDDPVFKTDLKTCTPAVIEVGSLSFFAISLSKYDLEGYTEPYYNSGWYTFKISMKDAYISPKAEFLNSSYKNAKALPTTKGKTFYHWLYNNNKLYPYNTLYFDQQYSYSSNKRVATINSYGTVKTKGVGAAKMTIKPAKASGKKYSKWIVVKPTKVTGVKLTKPKKKTLKVSWKKMTGASGYQIYRSTKKSSGYKLVKTIKKGSTTSWTNKKLKKKKKYYYKVRAYVKLGSKKYVGPFSVVKSKKTK